MGRRWDVDGTLTYSWHRKTASLRVLSVYWECTCVWQLCFLINPRSAIRRLSRSVFPARMRLVQSPSTLLRRYYDASGYIAIWHEFAFLSRFYRVFTFTMLFWVGKKTVGGKPTMRSRFTRFSARIIHMKLLPLWIICGRPRDSTYNIRISTYNYRHPDLKYD